MEQINLPWNPQLYSSWFWLILYHGIMPPWIFLQQEWTSIRKTRVSVGRDGEYQLSTSNLRKNCRKCQDLNLGWVPKSDSPIGTFGTCMGSMRVRCLQKNAKSYLLFNHLKNSWLSEIQLKHDHSILIWDGFFQLPWISWSGWCCWPVFFFVGFVSTDHKQSTQCLGTLYRPT